MKERGVILLVEDNKKILEANRWILESKGHKTLCAESLAQARDLLLNETPNVAVLDIVLPDGDGLAFMAEIKIISDIPVLFLSGNADQEDITRGLKMGAYDYMTKPYKVDEFYCRVESALKWAFERRANDA